MILVLILGFFALLFFFVSIERFFVFQSEDARAFQRRRIGYDFLPSVLFRLIFLYR